MLDQSDNRNYWYFGCVVISDLYLFQEIVLLNRYFIFGKYLVLSLIHKVTTGKKNSHYSFKI